MAQHRLPLVIHILFSFLGFRFIFLLLWPSFTLETRQNTHGCEGIWTFYKRYILRVKAVKGSSCQDPTMFTGDNRKLLTSVKHITR
jgi:hypothetical protein